MTDTASAFQPRKRHPLLRLVLFTLSAATSLFVLAFTLIAAAALVGVLSPCMVDRSVLTDGEKTVVFEGMIHVASPGFYDEVRLDIDRLKREGAVYFFESVIPDEDEKINAALSGHITGQRMDGADTRDIFDLLALYAGLQVQPQSSFLGLVNSRDVNVDVTASQLLALMEGTGSRAPEAGEPAFSAADVEAAKRAWNGASEREHAAVAWAVRSTVRFILALAPGFERPNSFDGPVIQRRNEILAEAVAAGPQKIVITYGQMHIQGVLTALHARDPRWHLSETRQRQAF